MTPTAVINIVALSPSLIGENTPHLSGFIERGNLQQLQPVLPAVTCSVQSSMLTGLTPAETGIVGNGWYNREMCEVQFWKQANRLVQGEKVWETARTRDPAFTCANMFWWYNMYSSVDYSVTPRPMYKADGRKIPDCYSHPAELRDELQKELGQFPLFNFWGPMTSITASDWIGRASMRVYDRFEPTLTLVYLPHLDYALQKVGPDHASIADEAREIDAVAGEMIDFFEHRGVRVMITSEYGIVPVTDAVWINRQLREAGMIQVRVEEGLELLDAGASAAFAVADHQVAHVYVNDASRKDEVRELCEGVPGVDLVLDCAGQNEHGVAHERAGDLVLVASPDRWFAYGYWLDDSRAPDFARTVEIHRKPGYDPVELFLDPALSLPGAHLAWKLLRKKLGFRQLMDVIPLDASLVRGSHGRIDNRPEHQPVLITQGDQRDEDGIVPCTRVRDVILEHVFE